MKFLVRVRAIGLLCIGGGYPMPTVDIPFSKRIMNIGGNLVYNPYIPGSSFKGALRSAASRISNSYGFKSCGEVRPELIESFHEALGGTCDVCKLFGYPKAGTPSPLIVNDLEPSNGSLKRTFTMTRIRLKDETLKVEEGALFKSEHVEPNTEFSGFINVLTDDQNLLGLLCLSLAELRLDRIGRRSAIDLKLEKTEELEKLLKGSKWLTLVEDLKRWLWE
ncbi:MAG: RAMP superfamily CRISPR-associated protein [Thermoproteota archaeon]|nr:hypothetical protein [Candidatus Brockarchaeota archaeon]